MLNGGRCFFWAYMATSARQIQLSQGDEPIARCMAKVVVHWLQIIHIDKLGNFRERRHPPVGAQGLRPREESKFSGIFVSRIVLRTVTARIYIV